MEIISRQEAKALGLNKYFTGKPCKHGHVCERRTKNSICVVCAVDFKRKWRQKNPERVQAYDRKKYYKHYERIREAKKKYYRKNREAHIAASAKHYAKQRCALEIVRELEKFTGEVVL